MERYQDGNDGRRDQAEKELKEVKKQKTQETKAHLLRREQITEQGQAAIEQTKSDYASKLTYWQAKSKTLKKQKQRLNEHQKSIINI